MKRILLGVVSFAFSLTAVGFCDAADSKRPVENLKVDVLVIGGGGAGLAAGAAAKERLKDGGTVLIVEKNAVTGGNSANIASPIRVPGTTVAGPGMMGGPGGQSGSDPKTMADTQYRMMIDWTHWRLNAPLVRTLILKAQDTSTWMWNLLNPEEQEKLKASQAQSSGMPGPGGPGGEKYSVVMTRICKNLGVEIMTNTKAVKLLSDKRGAIVGAVAEGKDKNLNISASSIIIATGGFIGNLELMKQFYFPADDNIYDEIYIKGNKYTGDGIKMAAEAGASMDAPVAFETTFEPIPWAVSDVDALRSFANSRNAELVWLDGKGRRFADESETDALNARQGLYKHAYYLVFDENIKDHIIQKKSSSGPGGMPGMTPGGSTSYDTLDKEFQVQIDKGYAVKTDSPEELAKWIGCDPSVLKATLQEYNEGCEKGYDSLMMKDAATLVPMNRGPYYAIKNKLAIHLTHGPIRVTPKMEVVDKNHDPIPGLYAAGNDVGGTDVDTYAGVVPAHSSGWAFAGGRLAGESAAAYITARKK